MIADAITEDVISATLLRGLYRSSAQTSGPISVYPLFLDTDSDGFPYISLRHALRAGHLRITEMGAVETVRLHNSGDLPVLLLGGEDLTGAMQNRVISSSTLVGEGSTVDVPVACSQRSRWAFESVEFRDGGVLAATKLRHRLHSDTHACLRAESVGRADQGRFWQEVKGLHERQGVRSATEAMRDAHAAREEQLKNELASFALEPDQRGMLVTFGSQPVGLDLISSATVYADEHERLLASYLLEAVGSGGEPGDPEVADAFLERVRELGEGERFEGIPGLGSNLRFECDGILGSALVHEGACAHAAFFDVGDADPSRAIFSVPNHRSAAGTRVAAQRSAWRGASSGTTDGAGSGSANPQPSCRQQGRRDGETPSLVEMAHRIAEYVSALPGLSFQDFIPYRHMGGLLTDASLQRASKYDRVVTRVQRLIAEHPDPSLHAFAALLSLSDPYLLLDWTRHQHIETLLALTRLLKDEGIDSVSELRAWLRVPTSKAKVLAVRGIADKTFQYLMLLSGDEDAVPVDRHLRRIIEAAGISWLGFDVTVAVYRGAARELGMTPARLEWSLFLHSSGSTGSQPR